MVKKRLNENSQITKEEFDAMQARGGSSSDQEAFTRASADQMKKRKIVSASKWKSAASSRGAFQSGTGGGVFGGVKLTAPSPSLASTSASAGASFAPSAISNVSTRSDATTTPKPSAGQSDLTPREQSIILHKHTLQAFSENAKKRPRSSWVDHAEDYVGYMQAIIHQYYADSNTAAEQSASPFASTATSGNENGSNKKSSNPFSFGAGSTSAIGSTPLPSFPPPSTGGTSMSSSSPSGFSFNANPTSPATVTTPVANSTPAVASGETPKEAEGSVSEVRDPNSEWHVRYQVRAQYYKKVDNHLKSFCTGPLVLETSRKTKKHRMVMRNEAKVVQLNLAIVKDMPFQKNLHDTKDNRKVAFVTFLAKEDKETTSMFRLRVNPANLDDLHDNLVKLATE